MKNDSALQIIFSILIFVSFLSIAFAVSEEDIVFPIAELGNCENADACKAYCDLSENIKVCFSFAEKHNLIPEEEIERTRKFVELGEGPGDCKTQAECEVYCNDINHMLECVSFAEENGLIPPEKLEEAKKVQAALAKGAKLPGSCRNEQECESYCNNPDNMEECITFAEAAGFIPPEELEEAKKVLTAIKKGIKPPACRGKSECDVYCTGPEHFEECITFGEAAGLIPPEKLEEAKKFLEAIKKGAKPPACRGEAECEIYCAEPAHIQECITFAEAAGFLSKEEAELVKKTGGVGPGGCRVKEECDRFCQDPSNQEMCFNFAREHGLASEADIQRVEEGKRQLQDALNQAPQPVLECLTQQLGQETIDKIRAGTITPSQNTGDKIRMCYETLRPQMPQAPPGESQVPPESQIQPGENIPQSEVTQG